MTLTKNQIQQLHNFLKDKGVNWYDIRVELVDHFANAIESHSEQNSTLTFEEIRDKVYKDFGDVKFKKLLKEKTKIIDRRNRKLLKNHFLEFFKIPKIIIGVLSFFILSKVLSVMNYSTFFNSLSIILSIIGVLGLIKGISDIHHRKQLLVMQTTQQLFIAVNGFAVLYNSLNTFTKNINSNAFNNFRIVLFIVVVFACLSIYQVYSKLKKEIENQYPEINIV